MEISTIQIYHQYMVQYWNVCFIKLCVGKRVWFIAFSTKQQRWLFGFLYYFSLFWFGNLGMWDRDVKKVLQPVVNTWMCINKVQYSTVQSLQSLSYNVEMWLDVQTDTQTHIPYTFVNLILSASCAIARSAIFLYLFFYFILFVKLLFYCV